MESYVCRDCGAPLVEEHRRGPKRQYCDKCVTEKNKAKCKAYQRTLQRNPVEPTGIPFSYSKERTLYNRWYKRLVRSGKPAEYWQEKDRKLNKKTPNDYPQVKFRTGKDLEAELASRSDEETDSAYSRVAKRDLERYYTLLARSVPQFSEDEALVLVQMLNGSQNRPETVHLLYAEVSSNPDVVDEELDADFIKRLKSLDRFSCMAIADAVERFWSGAYHRVDVRERLKKVGLVKGE